MKELLIYTAVFEPAEEGGYVVFVPSLPGCSTQGETFEESVAMIKDAISGYIAVINDKKNNIPLEKQESVITRVSIPNPVYS